MPRHAATLLLAMLAVLPALTAARAEEPHIQVQVTPREVAANDQVKVTITVTGPGAQDAQIEGATEGVNLISGGGVSTSTSIGMVNGRTSATKSFTLTYLPSGQGPAEVPAFTLRVGGRTYTTEKEPVTITEAREAPAVRERSQPEDQVPLEVQVRLDRDRLYLGQEAILEYRLIYRARVTDFAPRNLELVPGCLVVDEEVDRSIRQIQRDGKTWYEVTLFRRRLQPVQSGTVKVDPVLFILEVEASSRDPFEVFSMLNRRRLERVARGVTLEVQPLPEEGRPASFSGGVGRFRIRSRVDRTELASGEAAAVTVTVEGNAPLASASAPVLESIPDLKVFEPELEEEGNRRRSWVYPVVPQTAGRLTIPPVRWSYFDPTDERYHTAETEPVILDVSPGTAGLTTAPAAPGGRAIRPVATDLGFIKPAVLHLRDRRNDLYRKTWYWLLVALPWVVIPAVLLAGWRRERLDRSGRTRERRAARRARRSLRRAREALGRGEVSEAQRAGVSALSGYVADRAHRSPRGMTYADLVALAGRGGASEETSAVLREVVEGFDRLRYTPGGGEPAETERLIQDSGRLVTRMEKEWR